MKTVITVCLCFASALLLGVAITNSASAADVERHFDVKSGGTIDIELKAGGSVEIKGWDKPTATVEADFNDGDPDDYVFDVKQSHQGIDVFSKARHRLNRSNIDVVISLPRQYDVKIASAGGSIDISDLDGTVRGHTGGGSIHLENLSGTVKLTTGGGSVKVRDCKIDGEVTTGGGPVRVQNVEGDFDAHSGGGEVIFENVKTPGRNYPSGLVHIRNAGGEISVDAAPEGADVATGGGDINIRSARKFVEASTGGGDITVRSATGPVQLSTGAGDIDVTVRKDKDNPDGDVVLLTGYGDVNLTVPASMSMDVDIELVYTKRSDGRYHIKSDFDLSEQRTDEWEYHGGGPKKYIFATASINGGKNRIKIRTTNGNVYLNRGE